MECHIVARAKKGPRSGSIKPRDLDDYRNLILLCPTHHKEIDDQPAEYTIEQLREIKRKHEEWVNETLDLRAEIPDSFWAKVKQEAEALLQSRAEEVDSELSELVEGLGVYVQMTAELLASELVLFLRGQSGKVAFAFKYEEGSVFFGSTDFAGFEDGFSAFDLAPAIEDRTEVVRAFSNGEQVEGEGEMQIFVLAGATLLQVSERVQAGEAVFYIRDAPQGEMPQLAFRVEGGDVLFAAGPAEHFDEAFDDFATGDPVEITELVRVKMFLDTYTQAMEEKDDDAVGGFLANSFAICVLGATRLGEAEEEMRGRFAELLRNRFYEALLMLRAAHLNPDDEQIRAWAEENMDPRPPDGWRAALPEALYKAVREFAEDAELDRKRRAELEEDALDALYKAISLFRRFDEEVEGQEPLAVLILENLEWWQEPEPQAEILELAGVGAAD